jgi:type IV secretion system protein VirD4
LLLRLCDEGFSFASGLACGYTFPGQALECAVLDGQGDRDFERALRKDLRRGVKGEPDKLAENFWALPQELGAEWRYEEGKGLFLGRRGGQLYGWNDDRHVLTVAGTRAGKGASLIIPNLLLYKGSVLAIDPKGELARIIGRRRSEIGKLVVLDPFEENGRFPGGCYNPLDELDPDGREVVDEAGVIAQALVYYSGKGDPHWSSAAQALVRGLILLVLTLSEKNRNLVVMRQLLMMTHPILENAKAAQGFKESITALIGMMEQVDQRFAGIVRGQGEALKSMGEKERESVISEAKTQTQFLDSPAIQETLVKSDFRIKDLKSRTLSVFLCLPARYMDVYERWLRVIVNLAVAGLEPRGHEPKSGQKELPVLLLLEEFPVLRYMEKIEFAAGQLAGSGVKLWIIVQNFGQLERYYEHGWETFIVNAGAITAFANADMKTLDYPKRKLGNVPMLVSRSSGASSSSVLSGARPLQEDLRDAGLLETDELARTFERGTRRMLVLAAGRKPMILERALYYEDAMLRGCLIDPFGDCRQSSEQPGAVGIFS